ncbi:MAG: MarR family transcriptional regulator [Bacteroidetes bacterium MedPE-SWsnd-G2]|nr:MAG: MarR family transcriptional regulator [Bacteroidetes bacterium MedPE-SWsnd-G2]
MKTKTDNIDFENSVGPWLGRTVKLIEFYLQEQFKSHGLSLTKEQMIVLKKLHDQDGISQNNLAFLTLRDKSSLTRLLGKMENKGYIKRQQCDTDKRVNHVFITDIGREVFNQSRPAIKNTLDTLEHNITEEEKQQIIKTLKKIQQNFDSEFESI